MDQTLMIMLQDGLRQLSGSVAEAPYRIMIYYRVPENWIEGMLPETDAPPDTDTLWIKGPTLRAEKLDSLLDTLYEATWRNGNEDGSQVVVLGMGTRLLNPLRKAERPWQEDDFSNNTLRFYHYIVNAEGNCQRVLPSGL